MPNRFSAVILAAGESARLGSDKLSLSLGPRSILEHTFSKFSAEAITEIIIVTGKFVPELQKNILLPKIRWVHNSDHAEGMSSSVKKGFEQVDPFADAVFITPADIPLFKAGTVAQMIAFFSTNKIIIPTYDGKRGHPVLLDRDFIEQCLIEQSEKILYEVIRKNNTSVELLPVEDAGILLDIDTMEDYEALKEYYSNYIGH